MQFFPSFFTKNPTVLRALLPAVLLLASGCEKVLDLDLKNTSPKIVIEANISDQPGTYQVLLSKTVNFNEPNVFPAVNGAVVRLSDNAGNSEILTETGPGTYTTSTLQGVPGRNYFLEVEAEGEFYRASSVMPEPIRIDEILVEDFRFNPQEKVVTIKFLDPAGEKNFYRAFYIVNGKASTRLFFLNDEFQNGKLVEGNFIDGDLKLESGDTATVILQTIDENVFNYLREESQLGNSQASSPANPTSNLSNGALGYFSAHGQTSATVVVP